MRVRKIFRIFVAYVAILAVWIALLAWLSHANAHDIYTSLRSEKTGQLCCGGNDCEAVSYRMEPDGSALFFPRKNVQGVVHVAKDKITWMAVPGGEASEAHWCGTPRSKVYLAPTNEENPDPEFWTYCAFIAPGGV